ncbi:O-aminophenol oxidase PhsA [Streptomyces sp. NPDC021098]|uniref:O-aminophenol oxidase PhsA n=1 Tax=unclassified Streptomyces TaxID=2593676 RepID=UPI00378B3CBE
MSDTLVRNDFEEFEETGPGSPGSTLEPTVPASPPAAGLVPFMDALRIPPRLRPDKAEALEGVTVDLRATWVRLHSQLPPTRVWTYEGHFPGPTIEVRRKQRLRVTWTNRLSGAYPVTAYEVPIANPPASNVPGHDEAGAEEVKGVAELPPWSVTHLHGAPTGAGNDGWAQNAVSPGDAQLSEYPNDCRATALWYHDHAMHITRWNVFTGLAGMYLVRDEEEDALRLPRDEYEVPLVLMDRNLDQDPDGRLTGRLLHKVQSIGEDADGRNVTIPFSGPYTLVNGVIWPHFDVAARWYRFRVLNASNARFYRLALVDEETGEQVTGAVKQIGTDGGLLDRPVDLDAPVSIAPSERLDLLIDFSRLRGRTLRLVNTPDGKNPGEADEARGIPYPQMMQFRVDRDPVRDRFVLPKVLSSFQRITHANAPAHGHRIIALTPPGTVGGNGHPEIWELRQVAEDEVTVPGDGVVQIRNDKGETATYQRISRTFDDAMGISVELGSWEQWSFLNLGGPTHPMHIHLISFQAMSRQAYAAGGFDPAVGGTGKDAPVAYSGELEVLPSERGWKDTIQVAGGQMVNVIGHYTGATGRFMYHCHILEHEDMAMMRPFLVTPGEVLAFDHHRPGGGHHGVA